VLVGVILTVAGGIALIVALVADLNDEPRAFPVMVISTCVILLGIALLTFT
jgi:hypothetical protein